MQQYPKLSVEVNNTSTPTSNRILIKGLTTGALILIMLIPTLFITNLIEEREQRQKEVVTEVSNKWSKPQTISGPYIVVPYNEEVIGEKNKKVTIRKDVVLLPENLKVSGNIEARQNHRSIYNVLLYKSDISASGFFKVQLPNGIQPESLLFNEARVCIGLGDFKGIDGKVVLNLNGTSYELASGLPTRKLDTTGLSAAIALTKEQLSKEMPFNFNLSVKGSEQLSFVPLAGNSEFNLKSAWPTPSFNGNTLPAERSVNEKGFSARWNFNKVNLPFNTVIRDDNFEKNDFSFGVIMLQPADQYAKTMRSVKYAILFIGLTFSLFFIIELLQNKPVHPVQYVLVGLALVIFYTLLLSFSEFIPFDFAYLIAALATISLISLYAKGHFQSNKVASIFGGILTTLYAFIFVLIRLEDTALLLGSLGLFAVLALVMYASQRINWYNSGVTGKVEVF